MFKGDFIKNLPKIYGTYTGGFAVFIILMAIAEQAGVSAKNIGVMFVAFTVLIYALIGYLSRTIQVDAYYVAGRQVPTVFNGMATAADWMSGASFVALAGGVYFGGYTYMAFLVGWTGGYVLVATLMAPYLRKFGCYTVPDFIGTRYGGNFVRACAVFVLFIASFTYVTAQINATGTIASRALGIPFELGVWVGLISILICSMLGGMRAVTWTQVAQYIVLIVAYLLPVFWISSKVGGGIFPHLMLGDEVARLGELEQSFGLVKNSAADMKAAGVPGGLKYISGSHSGVPEGGMAVWKYLSLAICMMVGTASLPHILMRYFTTPTVRAARKSVAWSLFFIFLLYSSAPMLATLSKLSLMDPNLPTGIIGKSISEVGVTPDIFVEENSENNLLSSASQQRSFYADQKQLIVLGQKYAQRQKIIKQLDKDFSKLTIEDKTIINAYNLKYFLTPAKACDLGNKLLTAKCIDPSFTLLNTMKGLSLYEYYQ